MTQLDLLLDYKPKARLFSFPESCRVTMAHATAQELVELDFESAKKRWQLVSRQFGKRLRSEGVSTGLVNAAINDLAEEVHRSIDRLNLLKQYRSPAVILSLQGHRLPTPPHGDGDGNAGAVGQGTTSLVGLGEAHDRTEYDAARARDGGAA